MDDVRLIIDPPSPGPWNMAADEVLLQDAVDHGIATLRFYQWSEPTLSLGYFQKYADRQQHAASQKCSVVRRQSGGGAILHDRELTYSLVLPPDNPLTRHPPRLYEEIHTAFIEVLSKTSANNAPSTLRIRGEESQLTDAEEPFLCFQRKSPGDGVLVSDNSTTLLASRAPVWKVLGSAQRRHRSAILQHGSLLIERSPAAPELPGLDDLVGGRIEIDSLISAVGTEFANRLGFRFVPYQLSRELQSAAAELANSKYGSPAWTNRR